VAPSCRWRRRATIGESNSGLAITFGFALIVILLVLAAQFESLWSAIIVMATVPLGLACAVFAMLLTGVSSTSTARSASSCVVGIMAKNGILIVEFANQLRDRGMSVREAIENSANIRLRPVVMTMIATVLGGMPLISRAAPARKPECGARLDHGRRAEPRRRRDPLPDARRL
jgi:HAE1 family hydrophobic/amphiphilic exporter-1